MKAMTLAASFFPGEDSTPLATSTAAGCGNSPLRLRPDSANNVAWLRIYTFATFAVAE